MKEHGFTLIELLIVTAIIAILLTLAVPRYFSSVQKSKETVLKQNLVLMRDSIQKYYSDKGVYPAKLDDLARDRYLRKIPVDPITESVSTWIVIPPQDPAKGGVYDVQSGAPGQGIDGTAYSAW
jgi:general secretion pathway protein G